MGETMSGNVAFGTLLKIGGTAGTAVANVTSIEGPGLSAEIIDITAHDSAGSYREKVPSFLDAGEVTLRINYNPNNATHKNAVGGLLKLFNDKTSSSFALMFPVTPAVNWVFAAYVSAFSPSMPFDGKIEASVTLTVDGAPTLA